MSAIKKAAKPATSPANKTKITLDSKLAGEFQMLAKEAWWTLEKTVNYALDEWMEFDGASLYRSLVKRRKWMEANPGKTERAYRMYQNREWKKERAERNKTA